MVKRSAVTLLLALACCTGAVATQNLDSASGYVLMPDAFVAPVGEWELSAAYVVPRGKSELSKLEGGFVCDGNGFNLRALYGIAPKTEAAIGWQSISKDSGDASAFTVAAKTNLMSNMSTALAAGLIYRAWNADMQVVNPFFATVDADLPNVLTFYVVLDKTWILSAGSTKASIGLAWDSYSETSQDTGGAPIVPFGPVSTDGTIDSTSFLKPFFGLSTTTSGWTVMFDYKLRSESGGFTYQDTFWSLSARRDLSANLTGTIGMMTWNIPYTESAPGFFIDLTWRQ